MVRFILFAAIGRQMIKTGKLVKGECEGTIPVRASKAGSEFRAGAWADVLDLVGGNVRVGRESADLRSWSDLLSPAEGCWRGAGQNGESMLVRAVLDAGRRFQSRLADKHTLAGVLFTGSVAEIQTPRSAVRDGVGGTELANSADAKIKALSGMEEKLHPGLVLHRAFLRGGHLPISPLNRAWLAYL